MDSYYNKDNSVIFKVLRNKWFIKLFANQFKNLRKFDSVDFKDWRYKYIHWSDLDSLVRFGQFGLLRYRLKRNDHIYIDAKSLAAFCASRVEFDLFHLFYQKYQSYFVEPDLLMCAVKTGNLDIVRLLEAQTYPVILRRTRFNFKKNEKGLKDNYAKSNILSEAWMHGHFGLYLYLLEKGVDEDRKKLEDKYLLVEDARFLRLMSYNPRQVMEFGKQSKDPRMKPWILKKLKQEPLYLQFICDDRVASYFGVKLLYTDEQFEAAYSLASEIEPNQSDVFSRYEIIHKCHTWTDLDKLQHSADSIINQLVRLFGCTEVSQVGEHVKFDQRAELSLFEKHQKTLSAMDCLGMTIPKIFPNKHAYIMLLRNKRVQMIQRKSLMITLYLLNCDCNEMFPLIVRYGNEAQLDVAIKFSGKNLSESSISNLFGNLYVMEYVSYSVMSKLIAFLDKQKQLYKVKNKVLLTPHTVMLFDLIKEKCPYLGNTMMTDTKVQVDSEMLLHLLTSKQNTTYLYKKAIENVLLLAFRLGNFEYVDQLRKFNKEISPTMWQLALVYAVRGRDAACVQYLLEEIKVQPTLTEYTASNAATPYQPLMELFSSLCQADDLSLFSQVLQYIPDFTKNASKLTFIADQSSLETLQRFIELFAKEPSFDPQRFMGNKGFDRYRILDRFKKHWIASELYVKYSLQENDLYILSKIYESALRVDSYFEELNWSLSKHLRTVVLPRETSDLVTKKYAAILSYAKSIGSPLEHNYMIVHLCDKSVNLSVQQIISHFVHISKYQARVKRNELKAANNNNNNNNNSTKEFESGSE